MSVLQAFYGSFSENIIGSLSVLRLCHVAFTRIRKRRGSCCSRLKFSEQLLLKQNSDAFCGSLDKLQESG